MLPDEIKNLILEYHASIEEYPKRLKVHNELFLYFRDQLLHRLNEEFSFIFYPGFYQDLATAVTEVNGAIHIFHFGPGG